MREVPWGWVHCRFSARFGKGLFVTVGQDRAGTWVEPCGARCLHSPEDHHLPVVQPGDGGGREVGRWCWDRSG